MGNYIDIIKDNVGNVVYPISIVKAIYKEGTSINLETLLDGKVDKTGYPMLDTNTGYTKSETDTKDTDIFNNSKLYTDNTVKELKLGNLKNVLLTNVSAEQILKYDGTNWTNADPRSYTQQNVDWNTTDTSSVSYIKNKPNSFPPTIATSAAVGGIKSGGDITVDSSGNVKVIKATIQVSPSTPSGQETGDFWFQEV